MICGRFSQAVMPGNMDVQLTYSLNDEGELRIASESFCEDTGIRMTNLHDQPGLQLYTGNWIGVDKGYGGAKLGKYSGFCLETHGFTNAVNTPGFPSPVIEANEIYRTITIYRFTNE